MRIEYEDKIANIYPKWRKAFEEKDEAKVANMKAGHNENLSKLQTRIADLERTNSNYDSVLSSLTRFLSVEASKRNIKFDYEKGSRYKGFQGKPYANLHKIQDIMNQILKELDRKSERPERDCVNCPSKDEVVQSEADSRITMLMLNAHNKFVAGEATDRGINVSGDTSTMVHAILNELDVTREELIRCKLSRQKSDKSVGAVTETSDKGVSTVTEDDSSPSIDETQSQSVTEEDLPPPIGDLQPVTVVIVIEVNEAFRQIVESNPSLAPLKVELERLRARVLDECEQIRSPARLLAITMETRPEDDEYFRDQSMGFNLDWEAMNVHAMIFVTVIGLIAYDIVMFLYQLLVR